LSLQEFSPAEGAFRNLHPELRQAKSEIRDPKSEGNPKAEGRIRTNEIGLAARQSSDFGFRASDFAAGV
jgi:hypothetical protein